MNEVLLHKLCRYSCRHTCNRSPSYRAYGFVSDNATRAGKPITVRVRGDKHWKWLKFTYLAAQPSFIPDVMGQHKMIHDQRDLSDPLLMTHSPVS